MDEPRLPQVVPAWVSQIFGVLSGWLVFLFAMFLILIACSVALRSVGIVVKAGDAIFFVETIVAAVVSGLMAIRTGRVASTWLKSQSAFANYLWLGVAIFLVLFSFPSILSFSSMQDMQSPASLTAP